MTTLVGYRIHWRDPSGFEDTAWPDYTDEPEAISRATWHALKWPEDAVWVETITYTAMADCPWCDWTLPAETTEQAEAASNLHHVLRLHELIDSAFTESTQP